MMTRARRAFTLIEMLVIIIIIAVVAGIAVPSYAQFWARSRFDMAVSDVQDVFAFAREKAIANDTTSTVMFDSRSQRFMVQITTLPPQTDLPVAFQNTPGAGTQDSSTLDNTRSVTVAENCQIHDFHVGDSAAQSTAAGTVHFRGDGSCDGADFILDSESGYRAHLILMPATGRLTREDQ